MRKGRDAIVERLDESETGETNPSETWKNLHLNRTNVEAFSWKKGYKSTMGHAPRNHQQRKMPRLKLVVSFSDREDTYVYVPRKSLHNATY